MNIKYPGYSFTHALFAFITTLVSAFTWLITIITFGHVGRMWSCRIALWCIGHPLNVVYDPTQEPEEPEEQ